VHELFDFCEPRKIRTFLADLFTPLRRAVKCAGESRICEERDAFIREHFGAREVARRCSPKHNRWSKSQVGARKRSEFMEATSRAAKQPLTKRLLLTAALVFLLGLGWDGYRRYAIHTETQALAGDWIMVDDQGTPLTKANGTPLRVSFEHFAVDPLAKPRALDFQLANGAISPAIYRWEAGRVRVLQSSPGLPRAQAFTQSNTELATTGTPGTHTLCTFLLQRPQP
jgi:hypothetical protein